ncbi:arylsulfatase [Maribacter litoralis]|uniref:arylsulfatase n=1 Tax=Maribacter litoralis TaxID=2059726 RepID=UPI003D26F1CB
MFSLQSQDRPNVILVLTDDQGIGDLGAHGNPWLKTPEIDAFYDDAVRMTNFHVSPLCTPTRAAIMTGKYPINNGAWATYKGRDALSNSVTMADVFQQNGYKTALFGKWHLGDNYPNRPTDAGFDTAIHHLAGGIGELSDYWGNDYFDDVYYVNNEPKQFKGYCTDVWFNETINFIKHNKDDPFFVYLPLNAPHDPLYVDEKYAAPYRHLEGKHIVSANLYGMIANIDENFGKLNRFLKAEKLEKNTIVIFMSDNGTRFGYRAADNLGYNKGFKGIKGQKEEGGHRVPFFIRYPKAKIKGGKDNNELAAHIDLIPTLTSLCALNVPDSLSLDGIDFSPVLQNTNASLRERALFLHNRQDWRPPTQEHDGLVLQNEWRLLKGKEVYNIIDDIGQKQNLAKEHPQLVKDLKSKNTTFYTSAMANDVFTELPVTIIGSEHQKEIKLTIQHAIGDDSGIWKTEQVAAGVKNKNNRYAIEVASAGTYKISCMRWSKEVPGPVLGIPNKHPKSNFEYVAISPDKVRIQIANQILEKTINANEASIDFQVYLEKGKTLLVTDFVFGTDTYGVYYTYINKI